MTENPYRKLGSQTLIYGLGTIIPRILNYVILTVYYTRKLEVQEFGIITELYAYIAVLMVIMTYGMETGYFKFAANTDKNKLFSTTSFSLIISSVIFVAVGILFANRIASLLDYNSHPEYLRWTIIIIGVDAITGIFVAKLRIEEKIKKFVIIQILNITINIILVIFFLEKLPGIINYGNIRFSFINNYKSKVYYIFLSNFIASILRIIFLLTEFKGIKVRIDIKLLKNILFYSLPLLAAQLSGIINETIDRILLKHFLAEGSDTLYELGIYGANFRIAMLMTLFIQMFRYAADPFYFKNFKSKNYKKIYADIMKYFIIFCLIIFLVVMLYIDFFKLLVDKKFHDGIKIVPIILISSVLTGIVFNLSIWYKLNSKTYYGIYIIGTGAIITILLNAIIVPKMGYYGCGITHLISNGVMVIMSYYIGQKFYLIKYEIKNIGIYSIVTICIYFISNLFIINNIYFNMIKNTLLLLTFIYFINKKENLAMIFINRKNENKNSKFIKA